MPQITTQELRDIVVGAIAKTAGLPPEEMHEGVDLLGLGLDSLDFSTILIEIEDGVGAEVPSDVLDRLIQVDSTKVTIGDMFALLANWNPDQSAAGLRPQDEIVVLTEP